ncbi:response regulator transcription factor [Fodinicola feengrottensis]|uniref:Response regulator transcription factor n=1 Tax=Fodinicola feengrottensis TaxID=435914 RepID=A0ABN2J8B0_9ACTN
MIRVVVVDDEALVRMGFSHILDAAGDIEVVAAVDGREAASQVREHQPDLVLLDIRMPGVDGLTVLAQLRAMPQPPIVAMLTTFDSDEYVATALRSGANGFLLKDTEPGQLAHLVRALAGGEVVLSSKVTKTVVDGYLGDAVDPATASRLARLSDREHEVLLLIAEGLPNAEIGSRMHLSVGTVKDHVSAILTKLEVGNRVQAALLAERAGLLRSGREKS